MIDWSLKKKNTSKNKNIFSDSLIHWKYSTKRTNYLIINRWKKKLTPKRYTSPIIYKNPGSETRSTKSSATDPRNLDQKITPHSKRTLKTFPLFIPSRFANRVNRSTLDDFFKRIIRRRWIIDRGGRRRKKEKKKYRVVRMFRRMLRGEIRRVTCAFTCRNARFQCTCSRSTNRNAVRSTLLTINTTSIRWSVFSNSYVEWCCVEIRKIKEIKLINRRITFMSVSIWSERWRAVFRHRAKYLFLQ